MYVDGPCHYSFWRRYLDVFDHALVLARVVSSKKIKPQCKRADGAGVRFHDLPDYTGPWQYLRAWNRLRLRIRECISCADAFILRNGTVATLLWRELRKVKRPFGLEVVGDPWSSLMRGSVKGVVRPLARRLATSDLRMMCRQACAVAYVTRSALQRRYPASPTAYTTYYSSIDLKSDDFIDVPMRRSRGAHRLIHVGTLESLYKAPDVLLKAVSMCRSRIPNIVLTIVGDGRRRRELQQLACRLQISNRVRFCGRLAQGKDVRAELARADLFVLPSRGGEGVPRAMIEAMACGLPCIGSNVGGIPELLEVENMVRGGNAPALARKMIEVLCNPTRMERISARNRNKAKEYRSDVLRKRRIEFYQKVKEATEACASKR